MYKSAFFFSVLILPLQQLSFVVEQTLATKNYLNFDCLSSTQAEGYRDQLSLYLRKPGTCLVDKIVNVFKAHKQTSLIFDVLFKPEFMDLFSPINGAQKSVMEWAFSDCIFVCNLVKKTDFVVQLFLHAKSLQDCRHLAWLKFVLLQNPAILDNAFSYNRNNIRLFAFLWCHKADNMQLWFNRNNFEFVRAGYLFWLQAWFCHAKQEALQAWFEMEGWHYFNYVWQNQTLECCQHILKLLRNRFLGGRKFTDFKSGFVQLSQAVKIKNWNKDDLVHHPVGVEQISQAIINQYDLIVGRVDSGFDDAGDMEQVLEEISKIRIE